MMKLALILIASIWAVFGEDLFTFGTVDEKFLSKFEEDTSSDEIRLDVPVVFYGKKYETIFVNENGLLSFSTDVPTFFNIKFPLDYPIIAPFYSDVDIRRAGNIFYRSTTDSILLQRANSYIQRHFTSSRNFKAALVFIATWDRVGYYDQGADKTNTFQTVIATDGAESFSISIYTLGGLGWVKGTGKSSGQPDAKGQAGFSSGDGMYYGLTGSGTDQVRNLDRLSNVGVPGFWIFQISNVSSEHGIGIPDLNIGDSALFDPNSADSCEVGGTVCHSAAFCLDYNPGFCCECVMGYYGNGKSCLQDGVAQRINGRIEGKINNQQIDGFDIHSYVVVSDGRVYTAVSKVPDLLGVDLQPLVSLALPVSWAFSKQKGLAKNGFQLTGGVFNSTSIVSFPETGNEIKISHYFMGLDVYNYLEVLITIDGTIPALPENSKIEMPSHDEYYTSPARGILKSYTKRIYKFESSPKECHFTVDTTITFDACDWFRNRIAPQFLKVSRNFIVYDTREKILRFAATSKVSESDAEEDPCLQGTEVCSNNSMCVSTGDSFRCECKQGYEFLYEDTSSGQSVTCVDINECDTGLDQCHEHAQCVNELGSYSCLCLHGYHGDGFSCDRDKSCDTTNCGENTVCVEEINGQPKCRCLPGYKKDGDKCVLLSTEELYAPSCLTTSLCNENAACKYVDESNTFTCVCNAGYSGDGFVCIPDSENCLIAEFCSAHASCEYNNVTATYFCKCLQGYDGDGYECALHDNYDVNSATLAPTCLYGVCWCEGDSTYDGEKCISTSEDTLVDANMQQFTSCNVVNNCHPRAQCIYTSEADLYSCRCNAGYQGDGYRCALIIPEATTISNCDLNPDICHSNAFCAYDDDLLGSKCVCKTGFQGNGISCTGKDLCSESSDCDPNGSCKYNNIEGRYVCQCDIGYRGNGIFCEEDNEISDLSFLDYRTEEPYQYNEIPDSQVNSDVDCSIFNTCHRHATCIVDPITNLSRCVCLYGYSGDGQNCEELRPGCHVLNDCGRNAQCLYDVYSFSYKCQCNEGYKGDGYACNPLVNCDDDPSICDRNARCQLRQASPAQCVCKEGFIGDGFNCTALKKIDGNFLLIAQGMSILRVPFKPTHSDPGRPIQVQPFQTAIGVAIDCSEGKVYWGDVAGHTIKRSNYDGSNREHFLQNSAGAAEGIAIDHHSRVLYWVDSQSAKIEAASIDTQVRRTIVSSNLVNPRGIAVHSRRGKLYWSDWYREEPKIEVSNLDGSERSTFVREGLSLPNSLTIDDERDELCWTDAGYNRVECIGVDGEGRRSLNVNAKYPFGITNYEGQIYWTDWEEKKVLVADKSTGLYSGSIEVPFGGHGKLYGIVAVPNSCPTGDGPCTQDNGGCGSNKLCTTSIQFARVCL